MVAKVEGRGPVYPPLMPSCDFFYLMPSRVKFGDSKAYNSYRTISILPYLSKIYKNGVYNRLVVFIGKNKTL